MKYIKLTIILISVITLMGFAFQADPFRMTVLNVGYGDSILLELPNGKVILIDAGMEEAAPHIQSYLFAKGIKKIDLAVITHPHYNHFGGFMGLMSTIDITAFAINQDKRGDEGYDVLLNYLKEESIPVEELKAGMSINVGDRRVTLDILHPDYPTYNVNDNSLVFKIKYRFFDSILFSDIGKARQKELLEAMPELKHADIVTVPHHGRDISPQYYEKFKHKKFIVSTGEFEELPLDESQLTALKGRVYRTDVGHVTVKSNGWTTDVDYE